MFLKLYWRSWITPSAIPLPAVISQAIEARMMAGKPKYYVRASYNHPEWLVICQGSNNVVIAEVANEVLANLFLEFLNELPGRRQPKVKQIASYPSLKKKNTSE